MNAEVIILKSFADNYVYLLEYAKGMALAVDPGQWQAVHETLNRRKLKLTHILATHRHGDHTGGIGPLKEQTGCVVIAGVDERIADVDQQMSDGQTLEAGNLQIRCIATPGHTVGSVCFYISGGNLNSPVLFTGDTMFVCGCGRVFEGDGQIMLDSLRKLAILEDETLVYPGHDYTEENIRFALLHNPGDTSLQAKLKKVRALTSAGQPTVPSTLAFEKQVNPFLTAPDAKTFTRLRKEKDNF